MAMPNVIISADSTCDLSPEQRERLLEQWHRAVGRSRDWAR